MYYFHINISNTTGRNIIHRLHNYDDSPGSSWVILHSYHFTGRQIERSKNPPVNISLHGSVWLWNWFEFIHLDHLCEVWVNMVIRGEGVWGVLGRILCQNISFEWCNQLNNSSILDW